MVSEVAALRVASICANGITPVARTSASPTNAAMNQGTSGTRLACCAVPRWRYRFTYETPATTGPKSRTRNSFTNVPICTAATPIGTVAATTCGTAYTVSPAIAPYCVAVRPSNGTSDGSHTTITTPIAAVMAIAAATSSPSASIAGATAAIAELPQMALPQAISTASGRPNPSARPSP